MNKLSFLSHGWLLKAPPETQFPEEIHFPSEGIPAAVPGTVHTDLLNAGLIPDPFYADNEISLKWVHESDWLYETTFDLPDELDLQKPLFLVFEGLDTIAEIILNDEPLAKTDNMFRQYRFASESRLNRTNNRLQIRFASPTRYGGLLEQKHGKLPVALNSERVYLRKAQYSFGWDWGPSFPTMGVWRPVYLQQIDQVRIASVRFSTLRISEEEAEVEAAVQLERFASENLEVAVSLEENSRIVAQEKQIAANDMLSIRMQILQPALWWPNGYGEPFLYDLKIRVTLAGGEVQEEWSQKVGIRSVELQTEDNGEPVFRIVVNNQPIFARGANWIPADSFLPRVTAEKYQKLLEMVAEANMNILRVWGGGIYENDIFYQLCDELGLLVWQDFMFACGAYPQYPGFLENVREEARQNINRLQFHPSLALWCGNNENEWIWYQEQGKPWREMPGYPIYHQLIPEILKELDPLRPYWPSSPFGGEVDPNDPAKGNRHQWDIWSRWIDYQEVRKDRSLFVTEFGFQAPANAATLEKVIPEHHRHPQGRLFEFHNKQVEGNERLFRFLAGHLPVHTGWEEFTYLTQLNQALALNTCVEHWRSLWPHCAGSIIWQINDCWPVSSWALIDSDLQPKAAYHYARRFFAPVIVTAQWVGGELTFYGINHLRERWEGTLEIRRFHSSDKKPCFDQSIAVHLEAGEVKMLLTAVAEEKSFKGDSYLWVYRLYDEKENEVMRFFSARQPLKHLQLPPVKLSLQIVEQNDAEIRLRFAADRLALAVQLSHPELEFAENWFDLWPGERREIFAAKRKPASIREEMIRVRCLNDLLFPG